MTSGCDDDKGGRARRGLDADGRAPDADSTRIAGLPTRIRRGYRGQWDRKRSWEFPHKSGQAVIEKKLAKDVWNARFACKEYYNDMVNYQASLQTHAAALEKDLDETLGDKARCVLAAAELQYAHLLGELTKALRAQAKNMNNTLRQCKHRHNTKQISRRGVSAVLHMNPNTAGETWDDIVDKLAMAIDEGEVEKLGFRLVFIMRFGVA